MKGRLHVVLIESIVHIQADNSVVKLLPRKLGRMVAAVSQQGAFRWGLVVVLALTLGGGVALGARSLSWPPDAVPTRPAPEAGLRVESILAQLVMREAGLSSRQEPLVLPAEEVNAFLAGHVEVRDSPVWPVRVQIYPTEVELGGATTLGRLVEAGVVSPVAGLLPRALAERPVWIATRGTVTVTTDGRAEYVAHAATIGRQAIPLLLFWKIVGGRPRTLVWRMPRVVERVEIQPGRLVIHTRRPGAGRAAPAAPG
jgi:hypothetical protein